MKNFLPFLAAVAASGIASAQTTVLSEDFSTFVPTGWTVVDNNLSGIGPWEHDVAGLRAWHQDLSGGTADNTLISPAMDLSLLASAYLHFSGETNWATYLANHPTSLGDGFTNVEVTTDGGLTWTSVWTDTSLASGDTYNPDVDLSAYAGMSGVQIGIHYFGTFAHESWIDNVLVDDSPVGPPPAGTPWTVNLPTTFAAAPYTNDFEAAAGTIPTSMALTNVDSLTGLADVEAWCNVGQLAPCLVPFGGSFNLEMGLDPLSINYHNVRNAMVLGIDGAGNTALNLDFQAYDAGEESNAADGVWISSDGANWFDVTDNWGTLIGPLSTWEQILDVDLTGTPVDTSGQFYLMFQQEDNFPYNDLDGVGIDDIVVDNNTGSGGFTYAIANLVAGSTATFSVTGATAFGNVIIAYSLTGAGPTVTPFGTADMSAPIKTLTTMSADAAGAASFSPVVPGGVAGVTLYTQCLDVTAGALSNSLAEIIL